MVKRWLAGLLGGFNALNGLAMLMEGPRWYASMPGVPHTGPFNEHFVADIGAAFLAAGAALIARAWRPSFWPAAIAGAMFSICTRSFMLATSLSAALTTLGSTPAWLLRQRRWRSGQRFQTREAHDVAMAC